jgi:hypothetical protein
MEDGCAKVQMLNECQSEESKLYLQYATTGFDISWVIFRFKIGLHNILKLLCFTEQL